MKKGIKILSIAAIGMAAVACSSPQQMVDNADSVTFTSEPAILEVAAGEINAEVTADIPAKYFHPQAIVELTPVLVYEGGETEMEPYYFQGAKVKDNYEVVGTAASTVTKTVTFAYTEGFEKSYLELRGIIKYKKKTLDLPVRKIADGANTTYMLAERNGKVELKPDGYQEIIKQTAEGQILYTINDATVRNSELKGASVKNFLAEVDEIKANERKAITGTDIIAYASPDGGEELNTKLSDKRSGTAEKAFQKVTKGNEIDAPLNVQSIGQDWEGFQSLVSESNIDDKDLIIRVLSMYSDPAVREQEIKNMSAVYKELAKDVLPELRRARFIANVEYTNWTNEELLQLIEDNIEILDETALLRAATLVSTLEQKVLLYKKAIEKYDSETARFNTAAVLLNAGKTDEGEAALGYITTKDADFVNACGVVALQHGNYEDAIKCFETSGTTAAKANLGVVAILAGKYAEAVDCYADAEPCFNKALAYVLTNDLENASANLTCECPKASYLKAIIAARQGDEEGFKTNLEAASKCEKLAERATKDIEFAQFQETEEAAEETAEE